MCGYDKEIIKNATGEDIEVEDVSDNAEEVEKKAGLIKRGLQGIAKLGKRIFKKTDGSSTKFANIFKSKSKKAAEKAAASGTEKSDDSTKLDPKKLADKIRKLAETAPDEDNDNDEEKDNEKILGINKSVAYVVATIIAVILIIIAIRMFGKKSK